MAERTKKTKQWMDMRGLRQAGQCGAYNLTRKECFNYKQGPEFDSLKLIRDELVLLRFSITSTLTRKE